ncbi:hypothetical protein EAE96_006029 [Botrytis aclada]|nr:hypothetical protein EAE96_006029 [Botrytis aclada]
MDDEGNMARISEGVGYEKPLVLRPAVVSGAGDAGEDGYPRPLVLRPAIPGALDAGKASSQVVWENRTRLLVFRPAVGGADARKASKWFGEGGCSRPLVLRPAIPQTDTRHDLAKPAQIMPLQSTLPHRPRMSDESRRRYKKSMRKWIERKREREERERQNERQKHSEGQVSDRYESSHRQIDPAIVGPEIIDLPPKDHHALGNHVHKHEVSQASKPLVGDWPSLIPESDTGTANDEYIQALASEMRKKMKRGDEVKDFVSKEHTLEEWQQWGKVLVQDIDEDKKNWEEYEKMMMEAKLRRLLCEISNISGWVEKPLDTRFIQSLKDLQDKFHRALQQAEKLLPKTHGESKEVEKKSAAKRGKAQFVKTHVRAYVDSDSDDPSARGPVKRTQLPLRQKY